MTTRERAIEKAAQALFDVDYADQPAAWETTDDWTRWWFLELGAVALDALLAPETIPCPECGDAPSGSWVDGCPTCHGEGSVQGEPLLIARDRLERPESLYETFRADDGLLSLRGRSDLWELRDVNEGEEA